MNVKPFIHIVCLLGFLAGAVFAPTASLAAPDAGSVSGTVFYAGSHDPDHEVLVGAHPAVEDGPTASVQISGPGAYSLNDLPDGSYYISAFLDIHERGEGPPEFGEPAGWYDPNGDGVPDAVAVSGGSLTGVDITMADVVDEYIQGRVCYLGGVYGPGPLEVALHTNPNDPPVTAQYVSLPCDDFVFNGGPAGTYYVSLLYDVNASGGPPDPGEPSGWYDADADGSPDPVVYTGDVITGIDIAIGGIHYVDFSASGTEDGASWENAFRDLQDALAAAQPGEEIWVASGIYTPGATRDASFVLKHGVAVYGGFNGTETYRHQRNWRANTTILSGEIGDPTTRTDNAFHVVTTASTWENPLDRSATLDGFTISGGYANVDSGSQDKGGGFLNQYGYPTLVNLNFINNYAFNHGGAVANQYTQQSTNEPLAVINSTFSGNSTDSNGGGIANLGGANTSIVNCSFAGNTGGNGGGIVNLQGSHTEIHNTILWGNQGAEIALQDTATASVSYSLVDGGYAGGSSSLSGDPLFVDDRGADQIYGTLDDDLHLDAASPAIDAGDNTQLLPDYADTDGNGSTSESTPLDMDGGSRFRDVPAAPDTGSGASPIVDIGADEVAPAAAITGLRTVLSPAPVLGSTTLFAARASDGTHITFSWDFGDGGAGSGGAVSHTYAEPGVYQVVLTAANSLGSEQVNTAVTIGEAFTAAPGESRGTSDGALTIEIPASSAGPVALTYTPQAAPNHASGSFEFAGQAFQLQASDGDGMPILEPEPPFTLIIHYDEAALPAGIGEADLELHRYDSDVGQWAALTVLSRDPANDTLTLLLDHFSEFALFGLKPAVVKHRVSLPLLIR